MSTAAVAPSTEEDLPPYRLRVLVIGNAPAGPQSRGGMASVVRLMARAGAADPFVSVAIEPTYIDGSFLQRTRVGVRGIARACLALLRTDPDVLHVHLSHGGSVVRKALPLAVARRRGVAVFLHAHSFNFAQWFDGLSPLPAAIVRRALRADRVVVLSESQREVYRARLQVDPDRIVILHNPASLPAVDAGDARALRVAASEPLRTAPVRVVFLGRYGERKGIGDLVAAMSRLEPAGRERLRLVTAGDGEIDQVRTDVEALGLSDVVDVRGWVEPAERDRLLARSDVFALPSYDEALPMALIEAMAFGVVPVVTPVGGIPDLVQDGHNGFVVPVGDPAAIAAALTRLLDDDTRLAMGARARASIENLDAASWWGTLVSLWTSAAQEAAATRATARRRLLPLGRGRSWQ